MLLLLLCVVAPAVTVNFSSPPFTADFIVNQPGNSIAIRFPGVTNVQYIPGTFGYISNQQVYLGTNNFAGGGGGGSGITSLLFTNSHSPSVIGTTGFVPNYTNINNTFLGDQTFNEISAATLDGGLGSLTINMDGGTLTSGSISITPSTISVGGQMMSTAGFTGNGAGLSGVLTNGWYTNAGPADTYVINGNLYEKTNNFGGGGSGINQLTGDVTAGPGSGSQVATLKNTGTAGTYRSVTFDAQGRETAGTLPTTFAGYAISDTWPNLAAALTLLIPQSALGSGSLGTGTKALFDDQTYKTIAGGGGGFSNQLSTAVSHLAFNLSVNVATGNGSGMSVGDMNTDGIPDLVVDINNATVVRTNNRTGQLFPQASSFSQTSVTGGTALADVNADGRLDVIASSRTGNYVNVLTNAGDGTLVQLGGNYSIAGSGPNFITIRTGTIDGNPSQDFVVIDGVVTDVFTNDGIGNFAVSTNFPAPFAALNDVALGDLNADGTNDIVFAPNGAISTGKFGFVVMTNNQSGVFQYWTTNILNGSTGPQAVCLGDFNNDGKLDVALAVNSVNAAIVVFTNNGNGFGLYSTNFFPFTSTGATLTPADYNNDGKLDILATSVNQFNMVAYTNAGVGLGFVPAYTNSLSGPVSPQFTGAGDFNSDGWLDFATYGTSSSAGVNVYLNTPNVSGDFYGNGAGITNGQILVSYSSSAVTPANAWTPGIPGSGLFGTLLASTNYPPYISAFVQPVVNGNGGSITNISFCTTSAATSGTVTSLNTHQIETTYLNSGSTIISLTWALPTTTTLGKIFYLHSKSAITTLTITGTSFIDTPVTVMSAGQTIGFETIDGGGNYIRLQ